MVLVLVIVIGIIGIIAFIVWRTSIVQLLRLAKCHGHHDKGMVGLSFDDGPDWGEEQLIHALNKTGIKATFFWIWEKVETLNRQNPARFANLLQLLNQGGHEVGSHGLSCGIPPIWKRFWGVTGSNDILKSQQDFCSLLGYKPLLYRPHGIQLGRELSKGIKISGSTFVVGSLCLAIGSGKKNLGSKYEVSFRKARVGDIICGHDSCDCHPDFGIASDIAQVIPRIGMILSSRNLKAGKVSQVI